MGKKNGPPSGHNSKHGRGSGRGSFRGHSVKGKDRSVNTYRGGPDGRPESAIDTVSGDEREESDRDSGGTLMPLSFIVVC